MFGFLTVFKKIVLVQRNQRANGGAGAGVARHTGQATKTLHVQRLRTEGAKVMRHFFDLYCPYAPYFGQRSKAASNLAVVRPLGPAENVPVWQPSRTAAR